MLNDVVLPNELYQLNVEPAAAVAVIGTEPLTAHNAPLVTVIGWGFVTSRK